VALVGGAVTVALVGSPIALMVAASGRTTRSGRL